MTQVNKRRIDAIELKYFEPGFISEKLSQFIKVICRNCKGYTECSLDCFGDLLVGPGVAPRKAGTKYYLMCRKRNARICIPEIKDMRRGRINRMVSGGGNR